MSILVVIYILNCEYHHCSSQPSSPELIALLDIDRNSAAYYPFFRVANPPLFISSAARLRGFEDDLGLGSTQFASILSIFYAGYVFVQTPS